MRRTFISVLIGLMALLVAGPSAVQAKVDPLRIITERMIRAEILIVLDTSGSMAWHPANSWIRPGNDCGGNRHGSVDLCGDGMCTGVEGSFLNGCQKDCNLPHPYVALPGMAPTCRPNQATESRMFMVKRVLRRLLPDLRKAASFGLVTFWQSGYFTYTRAWSGTPKKVSVYWSRFEMEQMGAWDSTNTKPKATFVRNGVTYTLVSSAVDGSVITQDADSLYYRTDKASEEERFKFSTAGLQHNYSSYTWKYAGSFYTYSQMPVTPGDRRVETEYKGPQFKDASNNTWVYHRYYYPYNSQYISAWNSGRVVVPLEYDADTQAKLDVSLFKVMYRMNMAYNGGLWSWGGTPTGPAIITAANHFYERQHGTGYFASMGGDVEAGCRPRYVLVLTDGQANSGISPWNAAQLVYNSFGSNPIKTLVVGLPGLPNSAVNQLDVTADMGDDGLQNNSKNAFTASNETQLLKVIKEALFEMVKGDYTTTAGASATSGDSTTSGDYLIVPSTDYPGWKGHLVAKDLTNVDSAGIPLEVWDAGKELNSMNYKNRKLFTGFPTSNSGTPVPLLSTIGAPNINGLCGGCGGVGVKDVWQVVETPPSTTAMENVIHWLVGKGRSWRLGPIFRSTPAIIGSPPKYKSTANHETFRKINISREKLVYIASNEGILHAFRLKDGTEAFGYVPPNLWPKINSLYSNGGQPTDPKNFKWVLAASPRVEDMPFLVPPKISYRTELVQVMGPGDKAFAAIDITDPSSCTAAGCNLNDPPFTIVAHSRDVTGFASVIGETWSVPTLFYAYPSANNPSGRMASGSGYGPGKTGHYYNYFDKVYSSFTSSEHDATSAEVDYTLLTDTAAAVDLEKGRKIVATYQGDLKGRLVRYDEGLTGSGNRSNVMNPGTKHPFYYSPAVYNKGSDNVLLAAVSGSHEESKLPAGHESTMFLRLDVAGATDTVNDWLKCRVSQVCSKSTPNCPGEVPTTCTAPGAKALPVGPPLILKNKIGTGRYQYEAFFLFYEAASTACTTGSSWLIRISTGGATQRLVSATQYVNIRATGMSVVGGGLDVVITHAGYGGKKASAKAVMDNIKSGALIGTAPYVETWREVKQ